MARPVRFYFDLVCPYSYLESHAVEAAEDSRAIVVDWLPLELRPPPKPLLDPRGAHLRTDWTRNVYRRAVELGVELHLPRHQPRSTLPLATCLLAKELGRLRELRHAFYEAFFGEGGDIATDGEICRAAERAGLDADDALQAAYAPARLARLAQIRHAAVAAGVRGVPSLVTRDGACHWCLAGVDRLLSGSPLLPRGP